MEEDGSAASKQGRTRRHKIEIYYDILFSVQREEKNEGAAKPTRIHHLSNMSYDKFLRYLDELASKNMIVKGDTLSLTKRGHEFLNEYSKIKNLHKRLGLE
jgi:predicted transcriptional regulator